MGEDDDDDDADNDDVLHVVSSLRRWCALAKEWWEMGV